jgi:hypothetical protein
MSTDGSERKETSELISQFIAMLFMHELQSAALCFMFLSFAKDTAMKSEDNRASWVAVR